MNASRGQIWFDALTSNERSASDNRRQRRPDPQRRCTAWRHERAFHHHRARSA